MARVVAWRLGCRGGLCGVPGGSLCGYIPFPLCRCTLLPLCGDWWLVGATRCGSWGVRSGLRPPFGPACASGVVCLVPWCGRALCGSRGVDWVRGWGGDGPPGVVCPSFVVCVLAPVLAPSPQVPWPLAFPFPRVGGPPVVHCPGVVLPPVPCPCGRLLLPGASPRPLAAGLTLCPFCFRCACGGVVARPVGR